jgi:hypothetical protein
MDEPADLAGEEPGPVEHGERDRGDTRRRSARQHPRRRARASLVGHPGSVPQAAADRDHHRRGVCRPPGAAGCDWATSLRRAGPSVRTDAWPSCSSPAKASSAVARTSWSRYCPGAHALAHVRGIQDSSRQGRYHNTRYRQLAREIGLHAEQPERFGWTITHASHRDRRAIRPGARRARAAVPRTGPQPRAPYRAQRLAAGGNAAVHVLLRPTDPGLPQRPGGRVDPLPDLRQRLHA